MAKASLKGLVLSGGKGSRLRPFTYTGAKQLFPVANKPILFYAIEALVGAGISEIGVVTGDTGEQIRDALGDGERFGARISFIPQEAPLGVAHAVKIARPFLGDSPFVVFLGDNFLRDGILPYVESFREAGADCEILLAHVDDPREFGVAVLGADGRPLRLIEKPSEPPTDLAMIGIYMFGPRFFDAAAQLRPSGRGELEITDAVQRLIDAGADVRAEVVREGWIDTGKMADVLAANRLVLEDLVPCTEGAVVQNSQLTGRVVLQRGARVVDSVVRGPTIIGEATEVSRSRIGPYTSIYHGCRVAGSEIEDSVVLERCVIESPGQPIRGSLIGRDVVISGGDALRLVLGDHSQVQVP